MSESSTPAPSCPSSSRSCCAWLPIAALVLLRLAVGFHFFSEGAHKFEYDSHEKHWKISEKFAAINQGFLRGATGPWAEFYHNQLPTTHHWRDHLAQPKEMKPEDYEELRSWVASYVKRRQAELTKGAPTEPQFVDFAPAAEWADEILADWQKIEVKTQAMSFLGKEQRQQAVDAINKQRLNVADFVAEEALDMQAYQHELWRLANEEAEPGADEIPFEQERIAVKTAEVGGTPRKWIAAVQQFDGYLVDDLEGLLTGDQRASSAASRIRKAATDPQVLRQEKNTWRVAVVITGVGFCLLTGFLTPIAAVVGALFLLAVMASQPPWVEGARTEFFYYQLTEFAAFLLLAATCAGKFAGIDALIHRWWSRRRPRQGA